MALKLATVVRNAMLDALETAIGASPVLKLRTGAAPASISDADSGTALASITLPADWMAAASGGAKALAGTWQTASALATGDAAHFRLYASDGATAMLQGSVTITGGGGDMTMASVTITASQPAAVSAFTLTAAHG